MGTFWEVAEAETRSKREGLVESRLGPPSLIGERLDRARLIERLDAGLDRKLTLVTAPAGFGKTWLVADWLGLHPDIAQVWTSLDSRDNDATRLWHHVFSAMADELPDANLDDALFSGGGFELERILDSLSGALRECDEEVLVVLDDAHLIEDPIAAGSLESFIVSAPRSTHFVLIGRHDPMIRVARWRMADDLVELRAHDLQLTVDETADMVELFLETPVAASTVSALHERTGGWIAGCRMAINSAKRSNDPEKTLAQSSGSRSAVADLITEEILPELKPSEQRFLLETSLLNYLSGPLCDAITNGRGADAILERLARDEMLTIRSGKEGWYQYHELFREVLQLELRRTRPDQIPELSLRAARWLHDHSDPVEAISQALVAGEAQLAGEWLVEANRGLLSRGQDVTLVVLAKQIDDALDEPSLPVLATMGYAMMAGGSLHEHGFMGLLTRMLEIAQRRDTSGGREGWDWPGFPFPFDGRENFIAILTGISSRMSGDLETVLSLENLRPTDSGTLEGVLAEGLIWMERYEEAKSMTTRYMRAFSLGEPGAIRSLGLLAIIASAEGRLTEAGALADRAITATQDSRGGIGYAGTYALVARVRVEWERGCLSRAGAAIDDISRSAIESGSVPLWVHSRIASSRLRRSQGDRMGAAVDLDRALVSPSGLGVNGHFAERIAFEKARLALLDDHLLAAEIAVPHWRKLLEDGAQSMREHLLLARFAIVAGEDPQRLLSEMPPGCQVTLPHRIQLGILKSLTAVRDHDSDLALTELTKVMRLAAVSGHRQMFLDERDTLGVLLENAAAQAGIRLGEEGTNGSEAEHKVSKTKPIDLVDPLTERELEILQLLPSHGTYAEIGDDMGVSMNTVKYHVKAIYRKLSVDGRSAAVDRARESGLVHHANS